MATKKMTKKDYFNTLKTLVADNEELVAFIDRELALLERKSSGTRKPTKTQLENEVFKTKILETLVEADTLLKISEICEKCPELAELSNQRITHMLTALRKEGKVRREYVKKVAYFCVGTEENVA